MIIIEKEEKYRSTNNINQDYDMKKVTMSLPKWEWKEVQKRLNISNGKGQIQHITKSILVNDEDILNLENAKNYILKKSADDAEYEPLEVLTISYLIKQWEDK